VGSRSVRRSSSSWAFVDVLARGGRSKRFVKTLLNRRLRRVPVSF
jgi:hypothetical protein